ncbi:MAG: heme ABC exporter ATP-binding protein CcmA [Gemmatimonadaceae bacterium]
MSLDTPMSLVTEAPRSEVAIEVTNLARRFGTSWVLRGIQLTVAPREVVGVLGANGSGKSTLLRILATLLRPHAGGARVCGHDVVREAHEVRSELGYLAHSPGLYEDLTARENLEFAARMLDRDAAEIDPVLTRVGLLGVAHRQVRGMSAGMQRRLAFGRLMLVRPRVLLLDEPYSNLDTDGIALVNELIAEWVDAGAAALVVLHELAPAEPVLDRTVVLVDGRFATPPLSLARSAR